MTPLLKNACRALFDDIVTKKMYITGGIGSTHAGEAFTYAYDLPDASAYNETCASISLAMFCRRLWNVWPEGRFADVAEQAIYNTVLAGLSLSGDRFFYENPLAANARQIAFYQSRPAAERLRLPIIERVRLFDCSCCPPNLVRFVASIGDYLYSFDDNTIYTHLYMDSTASFDFHGQEIQIVQQTDYPLNGNIKLTVNTAGNGRFRMGVRIPGWCKTAEIRRNQHPVNFMVERGYAVLAADWKDGDCLDIILPMEVRFLEASPECRDYCGRLAVCRGPFVYCAEGVDYKDENVNVRDLRLLRNGNFDVQLENMQQHRLPIIYTKGTARKANGKLYEDVGFTREAVDVRLIPYFSWANRGANDMTVWLLEGNGG